MQPKVLLLLLDNHQDFQRAQADDARAAAVRLGLDLEIVFTSGGAVAQRQQLFSSLQMPKEKRPSALVVESATKEGFERVARVAVADGIGWVLTTGYVDYIDALRREFPKVLASAATSDEEQIARLMAQQYRVLLPRGGSILYVEGLANSLGAVVRRRHAEQALQGSKISIAKVITADWTEESAEKAALFWFKFNTNKDFRPELIAAQNDAIASGVRRAIAQQRPEWLTIPITGCDGLAGGGKKLVNEGSLIATVVKPPTAGRAMEMVAAFLRQELAPAHVVLPPSSYPSLEQLAKKAAQRAALEA